MQKLWIATIIIGIFAGVVMTNKMRVPQSQVPQMPIQKTLPEFEIKNEPNKTLSYSDVLGIAEQKSSKVFVYFTADWCRYCKQMEAETFSHPEISRALSKYFVISIDIDDNRYLAASFGIKNLPGYVVVDSNGMIARGIGFRNKDAFLSWLGISPVQTRLYDPQPQMPYQLQQQPQMPYQLQQPPQMPYQLQQQPQMPYQQPYQFQQPYRQQSQGGCPGGNCPG